jgi:hypothetical protein
MSLPETEELPVTKCGILAEKVRILYIIAQASRERKSCEHGNKKGSCELCYDIWLIKQTQGDKNDLHNG